MRHDVVYRSYAQLFITLFVCCLGLIMVPNFAFADVVGSLRNIQMKLTGVILPCLSVIGIAWAAISLLSGNEKAKTHVFYAILASAFGFGAQAIVNFISENVR